MQTFLIRGVTHRQIITLGTNYSHFVRCKSIETLPRTNMFKQLKASLGKVAGINHYVVLDSNDEIVGGIYNV